MVMMRALQSRSRSIFSLQMLTLPMPGKITPGSSRIKERWQEYPDGKCVVWDDEHGDKNNLL